MVFRLAPYLAESVPGVGVLGAIVGGSATIAKNSKLLKDGKISERDAVIDTVKETAGAGVATAFSAAVVGAVGGGLVLSLGVAVVAAVAGKYTWDRFADYVGEQMGQPKMLETHSDDELLAEM